MFHIEYGSEWRQTWGTVAERLTRPDAALGAITFAVTRDPGRYSSGLTGGTDSNRVFRLRDWVDENELWVYFHLSQMTGVVTLNWAHLVHREEPDSGGS